MTPKRAYFALLGGTALLIIGVFAGAYGINVLLVSQSKSLVGSKAKLASIVQQQADQVEAKKDIATYTNLYNISKTVVPQSKDQAETVRQIVKLAANSNVTLSSITFPSSTLGATVGSATALSTSTPAPIDSAQAALSQLLPVTGIPGVYNLAITVASSTQTDQLATYPQLIGFLQSLEQNRLTALVSSINISPDSTNHNLFSFTLTLNIYIKPGSPA